MIAAFAVLALVTAADASAESRIAAGEVVVTTRTIPGSDVPEATARGTVDAPPDKVWAMVSDCANYKSNMPGIAESHLEKTEPPTADELAKSPTATSVTYCRVIAALPFPFPNLKSLTRGLITIDPGKRWSRRWSLVEGDYVHNSGEWRVEPYGTDGKRSLVTYTINAQPKIMLPDSLVSAIEQGQLPVMIKNVRKKLGPG